MSYKKFKKLTSINCPELSENKLSLIIYVHAEWSFDCRVVEPLLDRLYQVYRNTIGFYQIEIDETNLFPDELCYSSLPLILFYKNGQLYDQISGFTPLAIIENKIKQIINL